jgi:1,4-dihydroxy-2-naphthoate octaprenyltransferase
MFSASHLVLCFVVAIALQVGVNYANDYSDGIKGTDENRVGPIRLVGQKIASPKSVFIAMSISFAVAGIAGIIVASQTSWWLIGVGAICMALAWFYTGGKHPYGYYGFGEVVVFLCFGLVATVGTFYVVTGHITALSVVASFVPGMYSVMILLANNIRDINSDKESGKKTLAVRIGAKNAKIIFLSAAVISMLATLYISLEYHWVLIALPVAVFFGLLLNQKLSHAKIPPDYISVLVNTSKFNLILSILMSALAFVSVYA